MLQPPPGLGAHYGRESVLVVGGKGVLWVGAEGEIAADVGEKLQIPFGREKAGDGDEVAAQGGGEGGGVVFQLGGGGEDFFGGFGEEGVAVAEEGLATRGKLGRRALF